MLPAVSPAGPRGPLPHSLHPKIIFWYDRTRAGRKRELASTSKNREAEKNRARCKVVVSLRWLALNETACKGNGTVMNMHVQLYLCRLPGGRIIKGVLVNYVKV